MGYGAGGMPGEPVEAVPLQIGNKEVSSISINNKEVQSITKVSDNTVLYAKASLPEPTMTCTIVNNNNNAVNVTLDNLDSSKTYRLQNQRVMGDGFLEMNDQRYIISGVTSWSQNNAFTNMDLSNTVTMTIYLLDDSQTIVYASEEITLDPIDL